MIHPMEFRHATVNECYKGGVCTLVLRVGAGELLLVVFILIIVTAIGVFIGILIGAMISSILLGNSYFIV